MPKELSGKRTASSNKSWQAHIKVWRKSGLSGTEYCRQRQLSYHAFIYWKKKLGSHQPQAATNFVPVPANLVCDHGLPDSALKVEVGSRFKVEVHDGFRPGTLARIIATLEECR